MSSFQFEQIGVIRSPYKEKFAVPRQPGLVKSANGELHLIAPYNQADAGGFIKLNALRMRIAAGKGRSPL